jgi:flagellar biosynthesis/type III secretory pathway M-ring protein FliF/YscJ
VVEDTVFKNEWADRFTTLLLMILLLLGSGLIGYAGWQWAYGSQRESSSDYPGLLSDDLSQREIQLQKKAVHLTETLLAPADFRLAVLIDEPTSRARQLTLVINRATSDANLEQKLESILWAGLALSKQRGDRIIIQSYAFSTLHHVNKSPDTARAKSLFIQRSLLGGGLLALVVLGFCLKRLQRGRKSAAVQQASDYQAQLLALKSIARQEPARVAGVLSAWLNDEPL